MSDSDGDETRLVVEGLLFEKCAKLLNKNCEQFSKQSNTKL